ncbi:MAG TPA: hypothetical protein VN656_15410 [Stellaceae bacterium]|jgi:hypothetical protein|nr:hypothetical protein [Stellaceae bacterium]
MSWSIKQLNLKWYEYAWAMLPVGAMVIGGAIGGICGGLGVAANLAIIRKALPAWLKFSATGAVTLVSVGAYFVFARLFLVVLGGGSITALRVDHDLASNQMFVAIKKADPNTYGKLRQAMIDAVDSGKSPEQVAAIGRPYVNALTLHYLPIASDQAIVGFTQVLTLEIDQINAKNVDACFEFLNPRPDTPLDVRGFLTPEVANQDIAVTANVIETGSSSPGKVPSREEVAPAIKVVSQALVAKYGTENVAALSRPGALDHAMNCAIISDLYKDVLQLPLPVAVPALRFFYSRNSAA